MRLQHYYCLRVALVVSLSEAVFTKSVTTKRKHGGSAFWSKIEQSYDLFANVTETTESDWGLADDTDQNTI